MIYFYPETFDIRLNRDNCLIYFLFGNDIFLIHDSIKKIVKKLQLFGIKQIFKFDIQDDTNWPKIFSLMTNRDLFYSNKIIILKITNGDLNKLVEKELLFLMNHINKNIFLIIYGFKLKKDSDLLKNNSNNMIYIVCNYFENYFRFSQWLVKKVEDMSLKLEQNVDRLFFYLYQRNLFKLQQFLYYFKIVYPDGIIKLSRIKKDLEINFFCFTPFHWIRALLLGDMKGSWLILKKIQKNKTSLKSLLRIIQNIIILIIDFKNTNNFLKLKKILTEYDYYLISESLIIHSIKRLSLEKLNLILKILIQSELNIYFDSNMVWRKLEILSLLFSNKKKIPAFFIYD
ncbi:MAG: DNA polymerase III subunit delta [Arsenophonus sp.]|nr:MAG: DNA polymerase III subunit delta [Arsenophonus sp.]